jgi:hypothetical protein
MLWRLPFNTAVLHLALRPAGRVTPRKHANCHLGYALAEESLALKCMLQSGNMHGSPK